MITPLRSFKLMLRVVLLSLAASLLIACGATMERTARDELTERDYAEVTLTPLKRGNNAFSFKADRRDVPCRGEIEIQHELGQTLATVTSRCGAD